MHDMNLKFDFYLFYSIWINFQLLVPIGIASLEHPDYKPFNPPPIEEDARDWSQGWLYKIL